MTCSINCVMNSSIKSAVFEGGGVPACREKKNLQTGTSLWLGLKLADERSRHKQLRTEISVRTC